MRLLYAVVLVSGCVSTESVVEPEGGIDDVGNPEMEPGMEVGDPVQRLVPQACATRAWLVEPDAKDLDVAVVPTPDGATVVAVAKAGGAIKGFRVDGRGDLVGELVTIRDDRTFTGVSATRVAERLVIAGTSTAGLTLDLVRDDLGARGDLGALDGTLVADLPVLPARSGRVAIVGGDGGITASRFEGGLWTPAGTEQVTTDAITSMTAIPYGDDAMIAWSTGAECNLLRFAAPDRSTRKFACEQPRIAMTPAGYGHMVYEDAGAVLRTQIRVGGESELANRLRITEVGSSPRVAFDGQRTWISYINAHGELVVGFVDERDEYVARAVSQLRPEADGYELVAFGDGLWVVLNVGGVGFAAQRFCAMPL